MRNDRTPAARQVTSRLDQPPGTPALYVLGTYPPTPVRFLHWMRDGQASILWLDTGQPDVVDASRLRLPASAG